VISAFVSSRRATRVGRTDGGADQTVSKELAPVAVHRRLQLRVDAARPQAARSLRRVFKTVAMGKDVGDVSTIEDEGGGGARDALGKDDEDLSA